MKIGLALSGGGVRGAVHIGILKALEENHIYPQMISGTSSGSMVAALYSVGYTPEEIENFIMKNANSLTLDFDLAKIYTYIKSFASKSPKKIDGFVKGEKIRKVFDYLFAQKGCKYTRDTKIPVAIPAVDINTAKEVMFVSNRKNLIDSEDISYIDDVELATAVRASSSYPVVFSPCIVKGQKLVDGGIRNNVPAKVLKDMGAQRVLAVNLGYAGKTKSPIDDIMEIVVQCVDIMAYQISKELSEDANLVIKPKVYDVGMFDFKKIPECVTRGYEAAIRAMPEIRRILLL